jgi:hypothetical protein
MKRERTVFRPAPQTEAGIEGYRADEQIFKGGWLNPLV